MVLGPELLGPTSILTTGLLWIVAMLPTLFRGCKARNTTWKHLLNESLHWLSTKTSAVHLIIKYTNKWCKRAGTIHRLITSPANKTPLTQIVGLLCRLREQLQQLGRPSCSNWIVGTSLSCCPSNIMANLTPSLEDTPFIPLIPAYYVKDHSSKTRRIFLESR